ncbi:hypothetical protein BCO18175_00992 [Burkholderia contaminans]|nr:hypothetical protein BCO18175_00992 [Burkholderia contaminans]
MCDQGTLENHRAATNEAGDLKYQILEVRMVLSLFLLVYSCVYLQTKLWVTRGPGTYIRQRMALYPMGAVVKGQA